jgi:hypothetical protein
VILISAWPDFWHTVDLPVFMQALGFVAAAVGATVIAAAVVPAGWPAPSSSLFGWFGG